MAHVLAVLGSPSVVSRTGAVLDLFLAGVRARGHTTDLLRLSAVPAEALLRNDPDHPAMRAARECLDLADVVVLGTPIYKAAYSGLLKVWLDGVSRQALAGRVVLAVVTGATTTAGEEVDRMLRPVLAAAGRPCVVPGVFVVDRLVTRAGATMTVDPRVEHLVDDAIGRVVAALAVDTALGPAFDPFCWL